MNQRIISCIAAVSLVISTLTFSVYAEDIPANEVYAYIDFDGDGIENVLENSFGTNPYNSDTDSDGVDDYTELFLTFTDALTPDGNIDTDEDGFSNADECVLGINPSSPDSDSDSLDDYMEIEVYNTDPTNNDTDHDGLFDGIEVIYGLNPLSAKTDGVTPDAETESALKFYATFHEHLDTSPIYTNLPDSSITPYGSTVYIDIDYDGINDIEDVNANSNAFVGTLSTDYGDDELTSTVSYNMDYSLFFGSNTQYSRKLAVVSSLISANIYANNNLSITSGGYLSPTPSTSMSAWMDFHGMGHITNYSISEDYSDIHQSEMNIGHREVTYNGVTKNIVCVVIRGTNETVQEWTSNFTMGSSGNNHQGFEIAENRLYSRLEEYLADYCSGKNNVLWITGHSRGAALANLLAADCVDEGYTVFAYTFATPKTTTVAASVAGLEKYDCIFNIINQEDFVTRLPVSTWGFKRYGQDIISSIETSYASQWNILTSNTYKSSKSGIDNVENAIAGMSSTRAGCYSYRYTTDGYMDLWYSTTAQRSQKIQLLQTVYPSNATGTYMYENIVSSGNTPYGLRLYQKPAFLMMCLAGVMSKDMAALSFATIEVPVYLRDAKNAVISNNENFSKPHYTESYYLLATKLTP